MQPNSLTVCSIRYRCERACSECTEADQGHTLTEAHYNTYGAQLLACVQEWRQTERKGVWLRVPIQQAHLVPVATQQG